MYFLQIFSEKIQKIRYHKDVSVLVAGFKEELEALEQKKDRELRRRNHVIKDAEECHMAEMEDAEGRHMAQMEDAEGRLEDAEERHMAEKEDDASKIKDLKRQLARVKNELQARTGVAVVLGT